MDKYLPDGCAVPIWSLLTKWHIELRIAKPRISKLGDYRPPLKSGPHRISVNQGLNKYSFLITLLHEIAHAIVWDKYKNRVTPHGSEWKLEYNKISVPFLNNGVYPSSVENVLRHHMNNPKAGHFSDTRLVKVLADYDSDQTLLEDLEFGAKFVIKGGRSFAKGPLQRTRFKCQSLQNKKLYLVHKLTPVSLIHQAI